MAVPKLLACCTLLTVLLGAAHGSSTGSTKLYAMRTAISANTSSYFHAMDMAGYSGIIGAALNLQALTFVIPTNKVWDAYQTSFDRLSGSQKTQVLGYQILTGFIPFTSLKAAPFRTRFQTGDYKLNVTKTSVAGAVPVQLARPGAGATSSKIVKGDAYRDSGILAHLSDKVLLPPKWI